MKIISACEIFYKFAAGVAKTPKKRGIACIDAENPKNSSHLDRFPINKISEVKKTLKRLNEMMKPPKWWKGSVDELKSIIKTKINTYYLVETKDGKLNVKSRQQKPATST